MVATVGQFVLLPVIGWLLVLCLGLQPDIARGMLLVAACPSGAMANVYTYLARSNVASEGRSAGSAANRNSCPW